MLSPLYIVLVLVESLIQDTGRLKQELPRDLRTHQLFNQPQGIFFKRLLLHQRIPNLFTLFLLTYFGLFALVFCGGHSESSVVKFNQALVTWSIKLSKKLWSTENNSSHSLQKEKINTTGLILPRQVILLFYLLFIFIYFN